MSAVTRDLVVPRAVSLSDSRRPPSGIHTWRMRSLDGQALNGVLRGEFDFKGLIVRPRSSLHRLASYTHMRAQTHTHRWMPSSFIHWLSP